MEIATLLDEAKERGGVWSIDGLKLSVKPKNALTPEQFEYVKAHTLEVIAEIEGKPLSDYESADFEAKMRNSAKPRVSPEQWIERVRKDQEAKGDYYRIPEMCLSGRSFPTGDKSLLEWIEELRVDGSHVELHIKDRYAFSITASVYSSDGETLIKDVAWNRWAYDEVAIAQLAKKARQAAAK